MRSSILHRPTAWLSIAAACQAQELRILSEFQRIGPSGEVVEQDRGPKSREILSPAVARNAYASYHLAVIVPKGEPFTLYVGQNPESALRATVYRELHAPDGAPDRLEPVKLPFEGKGGAAFWLDLWVDATAQPRRIKVEPQLYARESWVTYPMEVRITSAVVPPLTASPAALPSVSSRADASVFGALNQYFCGGREPVGRVEPKTVRALIRRNALQDVALAGMLEKHRGREAIDRGMLAPAGFAHRDDWCAAATISAPGNLPPEWYLGLRDFLYRTAIH